jgi:hypothetical protein
MSDSILAKTSDALMGTTASVDPGEITLVQAHSKGISEVIKRHELKPINGCYHLTKVMMDEVFAIDKAAENPWNTPEANAYFEQEWQHALKNANETLAKACACEKIWDGLYDWATASPDEVDRYIGRENYELFLKLVTSAPLTIKETAKAAITEGAEML